MCIRDSYLSARVDRIPLDEMLRWKTCANSGEFRHESGRFFSVRGIEVFDEVNGGAWAQPVLDQPELGLLGIAITPSERGFEALIQAKVEPGNINGIQLSPTVQATLSNQHQVHGGGPVPYLELFYSNSGAVLVDTRQSEHGAVFWRKRNRVMIVLTQKFQARPGFRWVELSDILGILRDNDLVHADTRAVLACMPWSFQAVGDGPSRRLAKLRFSLDCIASGFPVRDVARWISSERSKGTIDSQIVKLSELDRWFRNDWAIGREDGRGFEVVGVSVVAKGREVDCWSQPMVQPNGVGLIGLLVDVSERDPRLLVKLRREPGLVDGAELGPTVQIAGGERAASELESALERSVLTANGTEVVFDSVLSDEGGRFLSGRHRHRIVLTDFTAPPSGYRWCSLSVIESLLLHSHEVNMQLRSILVCLTSMAVSDDTN